MLRCICGYEARDGNDLDEHILMSIEGSDPVTGSTEHREARR